MAKGFFVWAFVVQGVLAVAICQTAFGATLNFAPSADARTEKDHPNTNYGTSTQLVSDGSPNRRTFVRFTVTGVSGTVQSSKLRFYVTDGTWNGPKAYLTTNSWLETGITWNNQPASTGGALDDKGSISSNTWVQFDLKSAIQGNGTYSFVLIPDSTDGLYMRSREYSAGYAPQLVLTTLSITPTLAANAGNDVVTNEGSIATFTGSATGGTPPYTYSWNLGDGSSASGSTPAHAYADNGTYTVTLTVTDAQAAAALDTAIVTVRNVAPTVNIGGPYSGTAGSPVSFSASATDPSSADTSAGFTYAWNFGDGTTGTGATPTHTYATANTYTVTLTVTDKDGGSGSQSTTSTINPAPPVSGNTYYVSTTGSDANPGTATLPFKTIQKAAGVVNPGDTVLVGDGVYTGNNVCAGETSVVCLSRGGTSAAMVTFKSISQWGAKVQGQMAANSIGFGFSSNVGYVRIEGFEIYGMTVPDGVTAGGASGIELYNGGQFSQIVGNKIHDIGQGCNNSYNGMTGIFMEQPNITVKGNVIYSIGRYTTENGCTAGYNGSRDHGMYVDGNAPGASNALIANNIFYNNARGWSIQAYPGTLDNLRILNNTFAGTAIQDGQIILGANMTDLLIANNTFYQPRTAAIDVYSGTYTNGQVANNLTTVVNVLTASRAGITLSNNKTNTDPKFINASTVPYDFHLQSTSPAINAGVTLSEVPTDYDGVIRPQGGTYDIGCYEYNSGATYYVSLTGSDSNPGSLAQPFKTLSKGVSVLTPGDTLYIRGGTYAENLNNKIPSGTSWTAPVTVSAYSGEAVIVQPGTGNSVVRITAGRSYIDLEGLTIDGTGTAAGYPTVWIDGYNGGVSHHIRIKNCEIRNSLSQGILVESTPGNLPDHNEFINLKVHDNGVSDFHHGLYIQSNFNLIEGCDVYRNAGWGMQIYKSGGVNGVDAGHNIVRNSKFHDNARVGARGVGIGVYDGDGNLVYNNQVWNNNTGMSVTYGASNTKVYNNTIYANKTYAMIVGYGCDGSSCSSLNTTIRNNIFYKDATEGVSNYGTNTVADHNLSGVNPQFVDEINHNFHLQAGSPAIDAGAAVAEVPTDFDGVARPQGSAYDIGAYER